MSDIIKVNKTLVSQEQEQDTTAPKRKLGPMRSLKSRIEDAKESAAKLLAELDPKTVPNRIAGILDDSGSTKGSCWNNEIQAFSGLLAQSNFKDTSYLLYKLNGGLSQDLTCDYLALQAHLPRYTGGGTPIDHAMEQVLRFPITRAFLISDGIPDNEERCLAQARVYKEKNIKLDTVFVSSDSFGGDSNTAAKNLMRELATITGGVFMCFDDLGNFSHAIAYLSPAFRDMLEDKKTRLMLGSGE